MLPLHDIRVIEIASFVAAPAAGALLADLGAERENTVFVSGIGCSSLAVKKSSK